MTRRTEDRPEPVRRALSAVARIATLPQVASEVISLVGSAQSSAADLERVIESDPVLSARILKVANSPLYGFSGRVDSIRRAVAMLGHEATRNVTVAASMAKLFQRGRITAQLTVEHVWNHSQVTASLARELADRCCPDQRELAYLAGLLHEIGIVIQRLANPAGLEHVLSHPDPDLALERATFGTDHPALGSALCLDWRLPVAVAEAVAHHHQPAHAPEAHPRLSAVIHVADAVAARHDEGGYVGHPTEVSPEALEVLGLPEPMVEEICTDALGQMASSPTRSAK